MTVSLLPEVCVGWKLGGDDVHLLTGAAQHPVQFLPHRRLSTGVSVREGCWALSPERVLRQAPVIMRPVTWEQAHGTLEIKGNLMVIMLKPLFLTSEEAENRKG